MNVLEKPMLARGGFETVKFSSTDKQVRILGRVPQQAMPAWRMVMQNLLTVSLQQDAWSVDISKNYFLRDKSVIYAWRVLFQGDMSPATLQAIAGTISKSPRPLASLDEQPLPGRNTHRRSYANGKGAAPTGRALVGPAAVHSVSRG